MRILDSLARSPARRIGGLSLALVWAMAWIGLGHHLDARAEKDKQRRAAAAVVPAEQSALATDLSPGGATHAPPYRTKKIQDIRVGERVMAHNPELSDEDRRLLDVIDPEPEPEKWRRVTLRMTCVSSSGDTDHLDIELLRPLNWIEFHGAAPGHSIELDMPELDAVGPAEVIAIDPCPQILLGPGCVVTGIFAHTSGGVLNLYVDLLDEPIGVTARHRFWSEDRQAFIEAGELRERDRLRMVNGDLTEVLSVKVQHGICRVFNLEVQGEHVYYVSKSGILVHNVYETVESRSFNEAMGKALDWLTERGFRGAEAEPFAGRMSGGNVNGLRGPGNTGYRIEWDLRSGAHINVFAGKVKGPHFLFPGDAATIAAILSQLFGG